MKSGWHGEHGCGTNTFVDWYGVHLDRWATGELICVLQYSPYLRSFVTTLTAVSFASVESSSDEAAVLIKKIWRMGTVQE